MNDPPVVSKIGKVNVTEELEYRLDLEPFISDEDDDRDELSLGCDDPAVLELDGLTMRLLYETWVPAYMLNFTVDDGTDATSASVRVEVENVNDAPYDSGWMIELELSDAAEVEKLMSAEAYTAFVQDQG